MNKHLALLLAFATPLLAEDATIKQPTILKVDRSIVSLKPGTVVELIARDEVEATIKYRNLTGKIPADRLQDAKSVPAAKATSSSKPAAAAKSAAPAPTAKSAPPPAAAAPARAPQTNYGKAVQKAKDSAEAHEKNLVRPANEAGK